MSRTSEEFLKYLDQMKQYDHVLTLLYWDMRTGTPPKGQDGHIKALTHFSMEQFKLERDPKVEEMLETLSQPDEYHELEPQIRFTVTRMKEELDKRKRIPEQFYEAFVKEQALSESAWEEAKKADDYSIFAPHLEKMIQMTEQMAGYTDPGKDVYDVLVDKYERGMDTKTIDRLFEELKAELIPLVKEILAAPQPDEKKFTGTISKAEQEAACELLLDYIGFQKDAGTMAESEHPFTLNFSQDDVRITNHYYVENALSALYSAIHEGGHAIFEQNVNPDYEGTRAESCEYMGIHESQSRFYENILGRNKNFWVPIYEKFCACIPEYQDISLNEFYHEINHVRNSLIRTEADEVTYCFHIILRYEIEKEIFRNHVPVDRLPEIWCNKMQEYLGICPKSDAEGILQDMHWSDGSFGYFPSYLLGSIYDGMYLEQIEKELGSVDEILASGEIAKITYWLNEKIHRYGSMREPKEVIQAVCGKEVSAAPLIRYFKKKYRRVYRLEEQPKMGILFDMDGTLWDSAENVAKSWDEVVQESGYTQFHIAIEDIKGVMGKTMDVIAELLFPGIEPKERAELLQKCGTRENDYLREHGGTLYPEIRKIMEKLKEMGYHLYIVSNCQSGYIEAFLDHYQFHDLVEDIECYGNNLKQKGDNIALLTARNDLSDAVYVGDIQGDYDATMHAGLTFIHAAYGFGQIKEKTAAIEAFTELPQIISSVLPIEKFK